MQSTAPKKSTSSIPAIRTFEKDVARIQGARTLSQKEEVSDTDTKQTGASEMRIPIKLDMDAPLAPPDPKKGKSILTNKDDVFDVGRAFSDPNKSGTIVTDKRRKRATFFGTIAAAAAEWAEDTKRSLKKFEMFQEKVEPKVVAPTARKEVIEKAGSQSSYAPQDDHTSVVAKLKTTERTEVPATDTSFRIKDVPKKKEAASWTHTKDTQEEKKPIEKPVASPTISPEKKKTIIAATEKVPAPTPPPPPEPKEESISKPVPPAPQSIRTPDASVSQSEKPEPAPVFNTPKPEPTPVPQPPSQKPAPEPVVTPASVSLADVPKKETLAHSVPTPQSPQPLTTGDSKEALQEPFHTESTARAEHADPVPQDIPSPEARTLRKKVSRAQDTLGAAINTFLEMVSRRFVAGIVVIGIIGSIGASAYFYLNQSGTQIVSLSTPPSFVSTDTEVGVPLAATREQILASFRDTSAVAAPGITHIYPTTGITKRPATATEIFAVLDIHAPSAFARTMTEYVTIGSIATTKNEPFFVIKIKDFDTAFAGMIAWEQFMSADLAPFFGSPITESFDPDARTQGGTIDAQFSDSLLENKPIRVLTDQFGDTGIVYGFTDNNTVLITTSREAFAEILTRMR